MKLIIDIPDVEYNRIKEWEDNITGYQTSLALYRAVRDGTPYEERPQGKWIFMQGVTCGGYYKCNKCGEVERAEKNYCSNCGSEMRGKEE